MKLQTYCSGDKVCSKKHVLEKDMATKTVSLIGFGHLLFLCLCSICIFLVCDFCTF